MRKVFLSSTAKDLKEYRDKVFEALERLDGWKCIRMEAFGAQAASALEFCRQEVRACDLFVGILGHLYGSCPEGSDISYTEDEYLTAEKAQKPCLMFLASEDFPLPVSLHESDEFRARQRAFRQRVNQSVIRDVFVSPQDLALRVITAIRRWEEQQNARPVLVTTAPSPNRPTERPESRVELLGEFVPWMCNRQTQEDTFKSHFAGQIRRTGKAPQVYVLPSLESEIPAKLVERFRRVTLKQYLASCLKKGDSLDGLSASDPEITEKKIDWPESTGTLAERQQRLETALFGALDETYLYRTGAKFDPAEFVSLTNHMEEPVVMLRHTLRLSDWDAETGALLQWYLGFWAAVGQLNPKPLWLVFLVIHYPPKEKTSLWKSWFAPATFDRQRIDKVLQAVLPNWLAGARPTEPANCLGRMLDEVPCIKRDDVSEWLDKFQILDEVTRLKRLDALFKAGECRSLNTLHPELDQLCREENQRRGAR